jgi:hypothetical protein
MIISFELKLEPFPLCYRESCLFVHLYSWFKSFMYPEQYSAYYNIEKNRLQNLEKILNPPSQFGEFVV